MLPLEGKDKASRDPDLDPGAQFYEGRILGSLGVDGATMQGSSDLAIHDIKFGFFVINLALGKRTGPASVAKSLEILIGNVRGLGRSKKDI